VDWVSFQQTEHHLSRVQAREQQLSGLRPVPMVSQSALRLEWG